MYPLGGCERRTRLQKPLSSAKGKWSIKMIKHNFRGGGSNVATYLIIQSCKVTTIIKGCRLICCACSYFLVLTQCQHFSLHLLLLFLHEVLKFWVLPDHCTDFRQSNSVLCGQIYKPRPLMLEKKRRRRPTSINFLRLHMDFCILYIHWPLMFIMTWSWYKFFDGHKFLSMLSCQVFKQSSYMSSDSMLY